VKRWLKDPLFHFLLLGGLMFAVYTGLNRTDNQNTEEVRISAAEVEWLKQTWSRQWQRPPNEMELRGLVTDYLKELLLAREAQALGLDENDTVVRRRLAQKMRFLVEDTTRLAEPDESELRQYFSAHRARYQQPATISFSQRFFTTETTAHDALSVLKENPAAQLGDPSLLPSDVTTADAQTITNLFGQQFTSKVFMLETDRWRGPLASAYGFHLVRVVDMKPAQLPAFEEAREQVLEDWHRLQQERANAQFFEILLKKYKVVVDESVEPLIGSLEEVSH
jgi:parvulin-like peptidyl-prolyl isomerase